MWTVEGRYKKNMIDQTEIEEIKIDIFLEAMKERKKKIDR